MGGRGINCTHSPTSRDYCALKTCGNRRRKTCGRLWAAKNPRLGLGVGVVGPWPAATSCHARGLAGFFQPRDATWFAGGGFRLQKFSPRRRAQPKPAPSSWLVKIRS